MRRKIHHCYWRLGIDICLYVVIVPGTIAHVVLCAKRLAHSYSCITRCIRRRRDTAMHCPRNDHKLNLCLAARSADLALLPGRLYNMLRYCSTPKRSDHQRGIVGHTQIGGEQRGSQLAICLKIRGVRGCQRFAESVLSSNEVDLLRYST